MAVINRPRLHPRPLVVLVLALSCVSLSACASSAASSASPGASGGSASPTPVVIASGEAAARLVGSTNPLLAGVRAREANAIGQANFWVATQTKTGWRVVFTIGWGDCQAGCIQTHTYTYDVTTGGAVALAKEVGDAIPAEVRLALQSDAILPPIRQGVTGRVTAGPVCPVEKPNDPACAPRPVANASLVVRGADGSDVGRLTTDANGTFGLELPTGEYTLEAQPVTGLLGTPAPIPFRVDQGNAAELDVQYDTGIR